MKNERLTLARQGYRERSAAAAPYGWQDRVMRRLPLASDMAEDLRAQRWSDSAWTSLKLAATLTLCCLLTTGLSRAGITGLADLDWISLESWTWQAILF